jgi:eukaryotic-like serine/threonine-protein kinase
MDAARWDRIQHLFHAALELPEDERGAFLEAEVGDDAPLADAVLALLEEDARGSSMLERGLADVAHEVLGSPAPMLRQIGPYRIVRVLGQGGMGIVYLAEREDLGSQVALKVLRDASLSPARRERFEREEKTLAQLNHPSIARLYDAAVVRDGTPYFVMEYVPGVPLTEHCRAHRCSLAERLRLFRSVCEAVQHAHGYAVIHRDLKPSNILVTEGGGAGDAVVKLLDFGIAKQLETLDRPADQTQAGFRPMTPGFAAPEQLRGEPVGVYSDVYALGVLLYELLAGEHPFDLAGLTPGQVESRLLEAEPERPSQRRRRRGDAAAEGLVSPGSAAWADLDVLCLTAMHKDPQRRYPTTEALIRDLDHFRRGEPLEARPDTLRYRTSKFLRRNRQPAAAAALAAAVLAALVAFHTVRLAEQRDLAQSQAERAARISEYLIGLFEAGDPYAAGAANLDVGTLLERGERRAGELADHPAVKANMLNVLGRVHTQLSDFDRAEPLLQRALELRRQHGAPLDIAESLSSLAALFVDTGDPDAAEAALREAVALRERHLPPGHPDLAATLADLGSVLGQKGRYADAEALHRLALRIRRVAHPAPHADVGSSLNSLAVMLFQQGDYPGAERAYREALGINQAVFGREHASVTRVMANLGKLYEELGDFATADSLLSEALRIRRATLGNDHFETAVGLGQLGGMLLNAREYERAERSLRESLAIRERILAPDHPSIGTTLNGLALVLQHRGEYDEAESLSRRVVAIYRESLGERHRFTGVALCNQGHLLYLKGEHEAANSHLAEGVSILEEVHPENHQELAHNQSRLGAVLVAQGRYAEAEPLLLRSHRTLEVQLGAEHARAHQAALRVVELYEAWGRPEDAAPRPGVATSVTGPDP